MLGSFPESFCCSFQDRKVFCPAESRHSHVFAERLLKPEISLLHQPIWKALPIDLTVCVARVSSFILIDCQGNKCQQWQTSVHIHALASPFAEIVLLDMQFLCFADGSPEIWLRPRFMLVATDMVVYEAAFASALNQRNPVSRAMR